MRVHPAPRKRTIAVQRCATAAAGALGGKKLRRLPHIDADVSAEEDAAALRFIAAAVDGLALSTRSSSSSFQLIATDDGLRRGDRGCRHGRFGGVGLWRAGTNAWRRRVARRS